MSDGLVIPLSSWIAAIVVPNRTAIAESVSPRFTVYVVPALAVGKGAGEGATVGRGVAPAPAVAEAAADPSGEASLSPGVGSAVGPVVGGAPAAAGDDGEDVADSTPPAAGV